MSFQQNEWPVITSLQWIYWLAATLTAAVTITIFLYTNFQTKADANDNKSDIEHRLDRIEHKIDQLLVNPVRNR